LRDKRFECLLSDFLVDRARVEYTQKGREWQN